jgi:hypothetical protein
MSCISDWRIKPSQYSAVSGGRTELPQTYRAKTNNAEKINDSGPDSLAQISPVVVGGFLVCCLDFVGMGCAALSLIGNH